MTASLLLGVQLEPAQAVVADALLIKMSFVRADRVLDRYQLRVARNLDSRSIWWIWAPDDDLSIYRLAVEFDERWRLMLDGLLGLAVPQVVCVLLANMEDVRPERQFVARSWVELNDRVKSLFEPNSTPADSCAVSYGGGESAHQD